MKKTGKKYLSGHPLPVGPQTENNDDDETDERYYKGDIHCGKRGYGALVNNLGLKKRKNGTSQDGHDESCRTEFGVIAKSFQGNAINGGEHQRHAH